MFKRDSHHSSTTDSVTPSVPAVAEAPTYFDEQSEFSGTLRLSNSATIDGRIEGEIECHGSIAVGPTGSVQGQIHAESVVVHGEVHGDIDARAEITLHKSARVHGDMVTEGIVIERGATVEGKITIGALSQTNVVREPVSTGSNVSPDQDTRGAG